MCKVCDHRKRDEIEQLLAQCPNEIGLKAIANEFNVPQEDLESHALMHSSLRSPNSIVRDVKLREVDMLSEVALEYKKTLGEIGSKLRNNTEDKFFEAKTAKAVVDLYLGCGEQFTKTIKCIFDINTQLNGPKEDKLTGLSALAAALAGSVTNFEE